MSFCTCALTISVVEGGRGMERSVLSSQSWEDSRKFENVVRLRKRGLVSNHDTW